MANLLLLCACFVLGPLLRWSGQFPITTPQVLGGWIIHVALPATILLQVPGLALESALALPALLPWVAFVLSAAIVLLVRDVLKWSRQTAACVILVAGLGNTSFVGLPLCAAFLGPESTVAALVADQLGSFLLLSTAGMLVLAWGAGASVTLREMVGRIAGFPPFWALLLAIALRWLPAAPELVSTVLRRLSDTLAPLALFSVGFQLRVEALPTRWRDTAFGLALRLVAAPALATIVALALGARGVIPAATVLELGMPPMITAGILASDRDLDPELANLLVAVGIPVGFVTLVVWQWCNSLWAGVPMLPPP
jgi:predicted permease